MELPRKAVRQPGAYYYPPVDLLKQTVGLPGQAVNDEVLSAQELLQDTIRSFGIEAQIIDYERGPSVTRYELELKRGVKLSKVTNLARGYCPEPGGSQRAYRPHSRTQFGGRGGGAQQDLSACAHPRGD